MDFLRPSLVGANGFLFRKRFYQAVLAGSAVFTAGIGLKARTTFDEYEPLSYGPVEDTRIEAYADVVSHSRSLQGSNLQAILPAQVREVADEWIKGMKSGNLKPLAPIAYEDNFEVPVKDEILLAATSSISQLNHLTTREMAAGNYRQAAEDAITSFEVASVLKYSDLTTVGSMSLHQRKALENALSAMPHLAPKDRKAIALRVSLVWHKREPLDRLVARSRNQYLDYCARNGAAIRPTKPLFYDVRPGLDPEEVVRGLRLSRVQVADENYASYVSQVIFAYRNETDVEKLTQKVSEQANGPEL